MVRAQRCVIFFFPHYSAIFSSFFFSELKLLRVADRKVLSRRGGKFAQGGCHVAVGTPGRLRQLIKVIKMDGNDAPYNETREFSI